MKTLLVLLAGACAISACQSSRESAERPKAPVATSPAQRATESITGEWLLTRLNDRDITTPQPNMNVKASGEVSGRGGVNTYTASLDPALLAKGDFKLSQIVATEMAGSPEARKLEREFFTALRLASRFKVDRERLDLLDSGKPLATFSRQSAK